MTEAKKPRTPAKKAAPKKAQPGKKRAQRASVAPKVEVPKTKGELFRAWADPDAKAAMAELCDSIVEGGHLAGFCKDKGFAYSTVDDWIQADPERSVMYARARESRSDVLADEILSIADEPCLTPVVVQGIVVGEAVDSAAVARNRLRADSRKWLAAKMKPRVYGDKVDVEHTGAGGGPIQAKLDVTISPAEAYKRLLGGA